MNAQDLLATVKAAGLPVTGLTILDPEQPETWSFSGLAGVQIADAQALVDQLLHPVAPDPSAEARAQIQAPVVQACLTVMAKILANQQQGDPAVVLADLTKQVEAALVAQRTK